MLKLFLFVIIIFNVTVQITLTSENVNLTFDSLTSSVLINQQLSAKFFELSATENSNSISNFYSKEDEKLCAVEMNAIYAGVMQKEMWALKVLDSWGKIPSGILTGHMSDLGNFHECLDVSHIIDNNTHHILEGKYCSAALPIDAILSGLLPNTQMAGEGITTGSFGELSIAVCIPKTCRPTQADKQLRVLFKSIFKIVLDENTPIIQPSTCRSKLVEPYRTVDIIAICIFSFFGLLMLLSTVYDYTISHYKKQPIKILTAFSITSNGKKLFQIQDNSKNPNVIDCLNGIRALSIMWIVLGHQYGLTMATSLMNAIDVLEWSKSPFSQVIANGVLAVDSFFLLSGCLVTWIAFKTMEKSNGRLNIIKMYIHRFLRLTPLLAALVLYSASLQYYTINNPINDDLEKYCQENWWSAILYVSNYVHPTEMCFRISWYLNVDTQLFVLSPLILIPLWKWGKIAFLPIIVAIPASLGYVSAEWMYRGYHYPMMETNENDATKQQYVTFSTHARVSPYLFGIVLGYYIYQYRNKRVKLPKYLIAIGWLSSFIVISTVLFGVYHRTSKQPDSGMTMIEGAIYEPFRRFAWAVALSWIIFACHKGFGGIVNEFLSFGIWQPIARLTYGIYLTHSIVQFHYVGNLHTPIYFSDMQTIFVFWSTFGITLCITVILVLAFESPIIIIENCIFSRRSDDKKDKILPVEQSPVAPSTSSIDVVVHVEPTVDEENKKNKESGSTHL